MKNIKHAIENNFEILGAVFATNKHLISHHELTWKAFTV